MKEETLQRKDKRRTVAAILAISLLSLLSAVFVALYVTAKSGQSAADERYRALAESTYRKSYYALLYNMDGLEGATNKLTVASGKALKQEYLADISSYATAAAENMQNFMRGQIGTKTSVLVESGNIARNPHDIPVKILGAPIPPRMICDVVIGGMEQDEFIATAVGADFA